MERLLAIGDIHGYRDKLERLLDAVQPTERDQVVFLGDYIDRGPDSCGVIELLLEFERRFPHTVFLRGNHEQLLLDVVDMQKDEEYALFQENGGDITLESYGGEVVDLPQDHISFMRHTRLYYQRRADVVDPATGEHKLQDFLFVHAGVRPKVAIEDQDPFDLLNIRGHFLRASYPMGDTIVVHGHSIRENVPGNAPYRIALDSGVYVKGPLKRRGKVMGGKLTCCDVLTREVWQV